MIDCKCKSKNDEIFTIQGLTSCSDCSNQCFNRNSASKYYCHDSNQSQDDNSVFIWVFFISALFFFILAELTSNLINSDQFDRTRHRRS
jgi:hypothetical protein